MPNYVNKQITLILEINNIKEIITKKNDVMAFIKASDEYRQIDLTLFPDVYSKNKQLERLNIIKVSGRVEKRLDTYQLVVSNIIKLS